MAELCSSHGNLWRTEPGCLGRQMAAVCFSVLVAVPSHRGTGGCWHDAAHRETLPRLPAPGAWEAGMRKAPLWVLCCLQHHLLPLLAEFTSNNTHLCGQPTASDCCTHPEVSTSLLLGQMGGEADICAGISQLSSSPAQLVALSHLSTKYLSKYPIPRPPAFCTWCCGSLAVSCLLSSPRQEFCPGMRQR